MHIGCSTLQHPGLTIVLLDHSARISQGEIPGGVQGRQLVAAVNHLAWSPYSSSGLQDKEGFLRFHLLERRCVVLFCPVGALE